ncbi:MAG: sugar ABC transporter substrate-binding protein [Rhizobiales bacterium]|nr:sugar ABC transporter substrate-binding protein [Hyphomicrobiales bacterium]
MFSLAKIMRPVLGLAAGLMLLSAADTARADETRVVFVTHGQSGDAYWSVVKNGMDDAAKTLGVKAEYLAPETFDMAKMAQMIDAAVASKPDGLVVSIADPAAISEPVKNAVAAGIPVIVIDSGGAALTRKLGGLLFLGQDEYQAGVMAGERVKALGLSKAVCVNHEVGNVSLDDRCAGFAKGLGVDVPVLNGVMDPTEMKNRIIGFLTSRADTQFILTVGIGSAEPGLMALDELGLTGKVKIGTFDLSPTILKATSEGKMEWGIDAQQYAMGYIPVVMFDLLKKYKISPIADYPTGPGFVTKETAASVIDLAKQGKR